jgi:hypothetical protein
MGKKILIIAGVLLISIPAFAAVQNVKVSGDISTYGVYQQNRDLTDTVATGGDQNEGFFATITRLRVDADLTDNVAATIRLSNERDWEASTSANTDVDLDLANITLKELFYSPLTLIIGRQDLRYGNALIVGDPDTNAQDPADSSLSQAEFLSKRKAFDAIRAILDYDPWTIDLVMAKIQETFGDKINEDETLYGINAAYKFSQYDAEAEGYFFVRNGDADASTPVSDAYVIGARGSLVPVEGLTLAGELAYQFGDYGVPGGTSPSRDLAAWAADVSGSYTWNTDYQPTIKLAYCYRSGEESGNSGDYEAWLPLYEDQTNGLIADYLFSGVNNGVNSNANIINLGGSIKPIEDLTLGIDWYHYILDEKFAAGGTLTPVGGNSGNSYIMKNDDNLGDEIDLTATYDYSEDVQFGLQAGWFLPGDAFSNSNDDDALEVIGSVTVSF